MPRRLRANTMDSLFTSDTGWNNSYLCLIPAATTGALTLQNESQDERPHQITGFHRSGEHRHSAGAGISTGRRSDRGQSNRVGADGRGRCSSKSELILLAPGWVLRSPSFSCAVFRTACFAHFPGRIWDEIYFAEAAGASGP